MRLIDRSILLFFIASSVLHATDWQFRGPNRDGIYENENLLKQWPENGPSKVWSARDVGIGFSSPAVTDRAVYVTALIGTEGRLFAFDHRGKKLWAATYGPEWDGGHKGARTTPTVVDDKIYLISGMGQVICLDTMGKILWTVDMMKEFGARNLHWGMAESPLVDGDKIFCTPGGTTAMMAALNRHSGKAIWQTKGNGQLSAYCSPAIIDHNGHRMLVTMMEKAVVAFEPESGDMLWSMPHVTQYDINPNTVLYKNGYLYAFSGYGTGGQMLKLSSDGKSATKVWSNDVPDSQMAGAVLVNGYIYSSGHKNRGWACVNWASGHVKWQSREYGGKGPIIYADGMLYLYSEKGDVVLVKPNPEKFEPISAFTMNDGSGEHWAHPVIMDGRLYIRHGDVMNVYDIASK
jgi:outer membrane protein assembly factor BamB